MLKHRIKEAAFVVAAVGSAYAFWSLVGSEDYHQHLIDATRPVHCINHCDKNYETGPKFEQAIVNLGDTLENATDL